MKLYLCVAVAGFVFSSPLMAQTKSVDAAVKQLEEVLNTEVKSADGKEQDKSETQILRVIQSRLSSSLRNPTERRNLLNLVDQIPMTVTSEPVQLALTNLRQALIAEQEANNAKLSEDLQTLLQRAKDAAGTAKTADDLDGVITELQKSAQISSFETSSQQLRPLLQQLEQSIQFLTLWQNYLAAKASGNLAQMSEILRSLGSPNSQAFIPRSALMAEQAAINAKISAELEAILQQAKDAVKAAKTPADLDNVITELQKRSRNNSYYGDSQTLRPLVQQMEQSLQFVTQWQNYLAADANQNLSQVRDTLRNLSNMNSTALVPRSEILRLLAESESGKKPATPDEKSINPIPQINAILEKTTTLESVSQALQEFRQLRERLPRDPDWNSSLVNLTQALTAIERTYQDFQAGLPTSLQMSPGFSGAGNNEVIGMATIARLRRELFLLVLPRYVGAPPDTKAKPDESISEFLDRIDAEASASGQLELRVRVQQTQRLLNAADRASYQEVTGLNNFVAAQNQEAAGQIMLAVTSYQQALRSGNSLIPAEFIGTRLAALKEAHPDDYRQGMELFLTPPMPPRMMPGDMRSFPVGPTPTPQATLELAVPPIAKDSPAASPAADKSPSPAPAKTKP